MLKNTLYAYALTSLITLTAFASEDARETINSTEKITIVENEIVQEPILASEENREDSNLVATACETEEANPSAKAIACKGKKKKNIGAELIACSTNENKEKIVPLNCENEEVSTQELQQIISCEICGKNCGGRHLVLSADVQQDEEALKINTTPEEIKAA